MPRGALKFVMLGGLLLVPVLGPSQAGLAPAEAGRSETLCREPNIVGTRGDDRLLGDGNPDVIAGLGGDDYIDGGGGGDWICGGRGNDVLIGGFDFGRFEDGPGNDSIDAGPDYGMLDLRHAPRGITVDLASGEMSGWGRDRIEAILIVEGSAFGDVLLGDRLPNELVGKRGADVLRGRGGDDGLNADRGNDVAVGGRGYDKAFGDRGTDRCTAEEEYLCER